MLILEYLFYVRQIKNFFKNYIKTHIKIITQNVLPIIFMHLIALKSSIAVFVA